MHDGQCKTTMTKNSISYFSSQISDANPLLLCRIYRPRFHRSARALPRPRSPGSDIFVLLRNSEDTYARSALDALLFARNAHCVVAAYTSRQQHEPKLDMALSPTGRIDALYNASTLNYVVRRASCAPGAALLTHYEGILHARLCSSWTRRTPRTPRTAPRR